MDEFELHQLIVQSRWEFDRASIMIFVLCVSVCLLCRVGQNRLSPALRWGLTALTLTGSFYFLIRGFAAMRRFFNQGQILQNLEPVYWHGYLPIQMPTLIARLSFLIACVVVALMFIRTAKQD